MSARTGMKDKSQTVNEMARRYKEVVPESEVKPEYLRKLKKVREEPIVKVGKARDFKKRYGLK